MRGSLVSIRKLFDEMDSQFRFFFGFDDKQSKADGIISLRLFSEFVSQYRQGRRRGKIYDLITKFDSLVEYQRRSAANLGRLFGWLDDMSSLDSGYSDDEEDSFSGSDGFATWRGVADSFEIFLSFENEFLEALSHHTPAPPPSNADLSQPSVT